MQCPKCHNHNIEKIERKLKTFLGTMVTIEYECLKCNVKFNLDKMAENKNFLNNEKKTAISETCPQCKNPNTNRLRSCEWCGNQIH
jgi:hypothetical protein